MSLFVDASEFLAFSQHSAQFPDYSAIEQQLKKAIDDGHKLQLHLHPQWLGATYEHSWKLDLSLWRIGDLSQTQLEETIKQGLGYLRSLLPKGAEGHLNTFRAGGWAIQPSHLLLPKLYDCGIIMESTVAPGAYNWARGDWYNFKNAPKLPYWSIEDDVNRPMLPDTQAKQLLEIPICSASIGRVRHFKALKESKQRPAFPEHCTGSYAGPNSPWQEKLGKLGKLINLGHCMLDFSTLSADVLIDITQQHMARFERCETPIPIVAIGHNKNFTDASNAALKQWLDWASEQSDIVFSDYNQWHRALHDRTS